MNGAKRQLILDTIAYLRHLGVAPRRSSTLQPPQVKPVPPPPQAPLPKIAPQIPKKGSALRAETPQGETPLGVPPPAKTAPPPKAAPPREKPVDFSELGRIVSKLAPEMKLRQEVLGDKEAQKIATRWKIDNAVPEVALLHFGEEGKILEMLKSLASAIDKKILPTRLIEGWRLETEQGWDIFLSAPKLKWTLASHATLHRAPHLLTFYRELPASRQYFLGKIPLILLAPYETYVQNPQLKKELWSALEQALKS